MSGEADPEFAALAERIHANVSRQGFMNLVGAELSEFEAVVFDPPRQGAEAQARELAKSRIGTVVAVSCNAASFARDAKILIDGGCRLGEVTPIDQFRYAAHVEIVARFTR